MYQYLVTAPQIKVHEGLVQLEDEEAAKREYGITPTDNPGIYQVKKTLYFINGSSFGCSNEIDFGVECQNAKPVTPNQTDSTVQEATAKGNQSDATQATETVEPLTVKELSEVLKLNIGETLKLLKEKYDVSLSKGADVVPEETLNAMIDDGTVQEETE